MAQRRPRRSTLSDRPTRSLIVPRLMRRPLAAAYLGLSPSQLDLLRARRDVRPVPVPSDRSPTGVMTGAVLYDRADLDEMIARWKRNDDAAA